MRHRGARDITNTCQTFYTIEIENIQAYKNKDTIAMEIPYFPVG